MDFGGVSNDADIMSGLAAKLGGVARRRARRQLEKRGKWHANHQVRVQLAWKMYKDFVKQQPSSLLEELSMSVEPFLASTGMPFRGPVQGGSCGRGKPFVNNERRGAL